MAAALLFSLIVIGCSVALYKSFTEVPRLHSEWLRKVICRRSSTVYAPAP